MNAEPENDRPRAGSRQTTPVIQSRRRHEAAERRDAAGRRRISR